MIEDSKLAIPHPIYLGTVHDSDSLSRIFSRSKRENSVISLPVPEKMKESSLYPITKGNKKKQLRLENQRYMSKRK